MKFTNADVTSRREHRGWIYASPAVMTGLIICAHTVSGAPAEKGPDLPAEPGSQELPCFASGEWKGAHAVYQHANFDAVMDETGTIVIYPKDNGVRMAKPLKFFTRLSFPDPRRAAVVKEFISPGDPVMQPGSITLRAQAVDEKTKHEAQFEVTYTFEGNEISAWGHASAAKGSDLEERLDFGVKTTKSHTIDEQVEQAERVKIVEGHFLLLKGGEGGKREFDYSSIPKFGFGDARSARSAELVGPLWGPRKIKVSTTSNKLLIQPYTFGVKPLYEGFVLYISRENPGSPSRGKKAVVTID